MVGIMNAFITVIPIFLIRYGLLGVVNRKALGRAAHTPVPDGREAAPFWVYQLSNVLIVLYPIALKVRTGSRWFVVGLAVYVLGIVLYAASVMDFARPETNGVNLNGLYRFSRNPMYVASFVYFAGCVLLTRSLALLGLLVVFQVSTHWIILSEERWCVRQFGEEYVRYMRRVRRYV